MGAENREEGHIFVFWDIKKSQSCLSPVARDFRGFEDWDESTQIAMLELIPLLACLLEVSLGASYAKANLEKQKGAGMKLISLLSSSSRICPTLYRLPLYPKPQRYTPPPRTVLP